MKHLCGIALLIGIGVLSAEWITRADDKPKSPPERFDLVVREDIFAGFNGDEKALKRGLAKCDEMLAKNPRHAEAMVWRGAGRIYLASREFEAKRQAEGIQLWTSGMKDLDEAVAIDPKNAGVRIPRAAVLLPSARFVPPEMRKPLLLKVKDDFETIYELQKNELNKIGTHPHGELRMGLAEVYRRLELRDKSREQLEAITRDLPNTKYATRAKEWLAAKPEANLVHDCIGCHTK